MVKDKMLEILKEVRDFFTKNPDWWPTNDLGIMTAKILDADHAIRSAEPTALDLIAQEREKQISKGYTVEHDQLFYPECQLAAIASDLCFPYEIENAPEPPVPISWNPEYWKKLINLPYEDRLRIAGAMLAGELDRVINEEKEEA